MKKKPLRRLQRRMLSEDHIYLTTRSRIQEGSIENQSKTLDRDVLLTSVIFLGLQKLSDPPEDMLARRNGCSFKSSWTAEKGKTEPSLSKPRYTRRGHSTVVIGSRHSGGDCNLSITAKSP